MLQFPLWKVLLVLAVLLWGSVMAAPTFFNVSGLPGWMPKKAVNLGLDLRGGVYLMMEVRPDDVIEGQLLTFTRDVSAALRKSGDKKLIGHRTEVKGRTLDIKLTARPDGTYPIDEALQRLKRYNAPVASAVPGTLTFDIAQAAPDLIRVTVPEASEVALMKEAMTKVETIVRRRIDPDGVAEIELTPAGASRLVLEAPGEPDPERLKNLLNRDGRMTFNLVDASEASIAAARAGAVRPGYRLLPLRDGGDILVRDIPEIVGGDIASAVQSTDENNRPDISFRLNGAGARKFFDTTRKNVGQPFAIVLDDVVMSAPVINQAIAGGNVQITGSFTIEEAKDLAAVIAAGEMPAKLQFLDQRVVSSTLGEDSIKNGILAGIVGLSLVAGFMILAYGTMGVFAMIAVVFNLILTFACLSLLGGTLTLPGIAGLILSVGMSVDANVLIFERIREEQYAGRSVWTATQAGYERAFMTTLDTNLTSLLAALVLYFLGAGPVRGFAATLALGIFTSVFTAYVVTRMLTVWWLKIAKPKKLAI